MIKGIIFLTTCASILAACSSKTLPNDSAKEVAISRVFSKSFSDPGPDKGILIVKRDEGIYGGACATKVYINALHAANIRPGEKVTLYVPAGKVIVSAEPSGICAGALVEESIDDVPTDEKAAIRADLEALREHVGGMGPVRFSANVSPEPFARGFTHSFTVDFDDEAARDAYLAHPEHQRAGARLVAALAGGTDGLLVIDLDLAATV